MKQAFWTTVFRLVIFALFVLYLKTFDDTLGVRVASWISPTVITGEITTGTQADLMSGVSLMQTTLDTMNQKLDAISTRVGVSTTSGVVMTGVATPSAT